MWQLKEAGLCGHSPVEHFINHFSAAVIEHDDQGSLQKKPFILIYSSGGRVHDDREWMAMGAIEGNWENCKHETEQTESGARL